MPSLRVLATGALCALTFATGAEAQVLSQYRAYRMGSTVAEVSALAGTRAEEVRRTHERPALLQSLQSRPARWSAGSSTPTTDAVQELRFSFYNDQLYRLVVDYGRERTEGMTTADVVQALTATYGTPLSAANRTTPRTPPPPDTEAATLLARWSDGSHVLALYHPEAYDAVFRLMLVDVRLEGLARRAEAEARRLDDLEAPQRERARLKQEAEDRRAAEDKARRENNRLFTP